MKNNKITQNIHREQPPCKPGSMVSLLECDLHLKPAREDQKRNLLSMDTTGRLRRGDVATR